MSNNHLAIIQQQSMIPTAEEWNTIHNMATALLPTGFLPSAIKTPEQAVAIILKGKELRIPPMYALSNVVIVQGKPTCSAELMLALVQRDHGMGAMRIAESTNDHCTVEYKTPGWPDAKAYTFTIKDAEAAGLLKNPTWKSYPAAMLRARCLSAVARMAFPGAIGGFYSPGELGEDVAINDAGEVVSVSIETPGRVVSQDPDHYGEPDNVPPYNISQARDEPTPIRPTTPEPETPAGDSAAMRRLHAVGRNHNFSHDDLRILADMVSRKYDNVPLASLTEANDALLTYVANQIADDPSGLRGWLDDYKRKHAAQDAPPSAEDDAQDAEAIETTGGASQAGLTIEMSAEDEAQYRNKRRAAQAGQ